MYHSFYGLAESPFDLTPNPRYLFLSPSHADALTVLRYAAQRHGGLTLVVGDAGTGKTTLAHAALEAQHAASEVHEREHSTSVLVTNAAMTRDEFIEFVAWGFQLSTDAGGSKSRFLVELTASLKKRRAAGGTAALIIDEAQCLSDELLEEVRLLGNIETPTEKLLSIILIGQPELADRLQAPSMRQLKQRIGLRCSLRPLEPEETAAYIATRLRVAGGDAATIFNAPAVDLVHRVAAGIPRVVSVVCENALISGFALKRRPIGTSVVAEVCRDLDLALPGDVGDLADKTTRIEPASFTFF